MIKKIIKTLFILPAVFAGFIFLCGLSRTLPKNVTVDGVEVGGLTRAEASQKIRAREEEYLKSRTLTVAGERGEYTFTYPEINYKDNVYTLLKNAKKGDSLNAEFKVYLNGLNEIARNICLNEEVEAVEPYAIFNKSGEAFTYFEGNDGRRVDESKLKEDIKTALNGDFNTVTPTYYGVNRTRTLDYVKERTRKLGAFTTYFDGTNLSRASNIRIASARLNGVVLKAGQTLSFNDIVGERTTARGFLPAKIILNGEYTDGVGGGVCQVSTTLYNTALLSGLEIEEYHPHSLAVGYVSPSRDAMVSGKSLDLKIRNNGDCPVYIRSKATGGSVSFAFYGLDSGAEYSISTQVTGTVPADEEETDDPAKARDKKDGILSESYLTVTRDGYKKTVLLRKDKYLPIKGYTVREPQADPSDGDEPII